MTIKEIRTYTGLTQKQFAIKYHLPDRALEHWEASGTNHREPPSYLVEYLAHLTGYCTVADWLLTNQH